MGGRVGRWRKIGLGRARLGMDRLGAGTVRFGTSRLVMARVRQSPRGRQSGAARRYFCFRRNTRSPCVWDRLTFIRISTRREGSISACGANPHTGGRRSDAGGRYRVKGALCVGVSGEPVERQAWASLRRGAALIGRRQALTPDMGRTAESIGGSPCPRPASDGSHPRSMAPTIPWRI